MTSTNTSSAAALRAAADLLDAHPELPHQPYITTSTDGTVSLSWYLSIRAEGHDAQKHAATAIVRSLGGRWNKVEAGEDFRFTQPRGQLRLLVQVDRPAVCERVVVGTQTVTREIPAQAAVEAHTVTETVEKVEWRCQPLLADATESGAA